MYYPFLRGRQNELLALQELLKNSKLSENIVPIIEPVKMSPTLLKTLRLFEERKRTIVLIKNPKVGSLRSDIQNPKNAKNFESLRDLVNAHESFIKYGIYAGKKSVEQVARIESNGFNVDDKVIAICLDRDVIDYCKDAFGKKESPVVVPYAPSFRRIHNAKILIEDKFNKKARNSEYLDCPDEFFSEDHLYYDDYGYVGFSDYSIIGEEYSESGFAPYAVAIHIVYFDDKKELRIHHFVSDSNDDISDPAGKFYEALTKLHEWNQTHSLDTIAMNEFEKIYAMQTYPGLGVVKKLSVMHHLELISGFLDGALS